MVDLINKKDFDVLNEEMVLMDFYADWCGPCKMIKPYVEEISNTLTNVKFVKINVDNSPELAQLFGVQSIPTLVLLKNKQEISRKIGFMPKNGIENWLKQSFSI